MTLPGLSTSQLRGFVEDYWEHRPVMWRQALSHPRLSEEAVFKQLVQIRDAYEAGHEAHIRTGLGDGSFFRWINTSLIPGRQDVSLQAYADRIGDQRERADFQIVYNHYHEWDAELFRDLRRGLRGLFEHTGLPADATDAVMFVGRYGRGFLGLHQDSGIGVFKTVVCGRKTLYVWPEQYWYHYMRENRVHQIDQLRGVDFSQHLDAAEVFEIEPGDVVYWPAGAFHVARSDEFCVSLSVAISHAFDETPHPIQSLIETALEAFANQNKIPSFLPFGPENKMAHFSPAYLNGLARASAEVSKPGGSFEQTLLIRWLEKLSTTGLRGKISPREVPSIQPDDQFVAVEGLPFVYTDAYVGQVLCAVNGHFFTFETEEPEGGINAVAVLDEMASGRPFSIRSLARMFSEHPGGAVHEEVRGAIMQLYQLHGIDRA